jgi:RNA polymerase primary sigma factor
MKRTFINLAMESLAAELGKGLARLRRGYIDSAEELFQIVVPEVDYPMDFVRFRISGFRGRPNESVQELISGRDLREDIKSLILLICDSSDLRVEDYEGAIYDIETLGKRFNVSTKTIQRWRGNGLVARRLVFSDGRRRVAFCEASVERFAASHGDLIDRSSRFSHMDEMQRQLIIRRARELVDEESMGLSDVARMLSTETGRAMETIRYTLRKHDLDHPGRALFSASHAALAESDKQAIYRAYLRGLSVANLCRHYERTRASIYRVINEMRARTLLNREVQYIYNPQFDLPNADVVILKGLMDASKFPPAPPMLRTGQGDLMPYLQSLYDVPLLTPEEERDLFRQYNYLKHRACQLRDQIEPAEVRISQLRQVEQLLIQANLVKNRIVQANLRLVVSIGKRHVGVLQTLSELISDGNISLMQAVEKFDYARGNRFSTYASWAISRNYARSLPRAKVRREHFVTGHEEIFDIASGPESQNEADLNIRELRESLDVVLSQLTGVERAIVVGHYGLEGKSAPRTLEQLGKKLELSKERVRQIEIRALRKLQKVLDSQRTELLG